MKKTGKRRQIIGVFFIYKFFILRKNTYCLWKSITVLFSMERVNMKIRKDLIEKELTSDRNREYVFKKIKLSKKYIDILFNQYDVIQLCENFYDSEPEVEDELFHMYMDYKCVDKLTGRTLWNLLSNSEENSEDSIDNKKAHTYSKNPHTKEELKEAYDKVKNIYLEYEPRRLEFCNWQDPYEAGIWGMSQFACDIMTRDILRDLRKTISLKDRVYAAIDKQNKELLIYIYGRDVLCEDYWIFLHKRNKRRK